jgi:dGTPase
MASSRSSIRHRLEQRERLLSPFAAKSAQSVGRAIPEPPSNVRTEYQRDRDRIIHSKAFRRLKHKTQVFIAPLGDHYATRLTHTLEVSQIARTIARALNLNEDLAEAIALGHDLGHTPFGHIGEDELDKILPNGFRHSRQSLNIVERIEREGRGLNLTWEVRQGILNHSKPRGNFLAAINESITLEAQIVRISDAVAYINHDLADAFRAGIISDDNLPTSVAPTLGSRHSERINTIVCDIIDNSYYASGLHGTADSTNGASPEPQPSITMGTEVRSAFTELREFMFDTVYLPIDDSPEGESARRIVRFLYSYFGERHDEIPPEYDQRSRTPAEAVTDYVSGMTDLYAIRLAEKLAPGIAKTFSERLL